MPRKGGHTVVLCVPSSSSAGALCACERTRWRLGVHAVASGACRLAGVPGIAGQRQCEHAIAAVAQATHTHAMERLGGQEAHARQEQTTSGESSGHQRRSAIRNRR
jgi:hypothetical protein